MKKKIEIVLHEKVEEFILNLQERDRNKILQILCVLGERNLEVSSEWLKKVTENLWELRIRNCRLFYSIEGNTMKIWHGFIKKTMKIPKREIELALERMKKEEIR
ncbi:MULTISPECIES: type II toxin-antitoxin system RelE/ParE family toxin [Thermodesulfovibrio]|uniref:Type II toxin-antitoxin system RelE/ParE family toxin n=1 Tax=Thermodesulfovibrio yellowstonii (strain ATCC 51303 / DSM 11347 / YP87) TaxID=289376 RepID=B5YHR0_THEYD|nr:MULTISPECIES: type II toxin-antitoxin system RelE/ParE family toxin [Thermodesulfovibrio]ACI20717.1 conserved hypothetical protein [Thermodesulfovibrio yellowstonii DSM 11347]MDI6865712.1 type II toxin-antitoxin system RelE/ParE family toxin [Thermodesulfovibrio yellowstonii]